MTPAPGYLRGFPPAVVSQAFLPFYLGSPQLCLCWSPRQRSRLQTLPHLLSGSQGKALSCRALKATVKISLGGTYLPAINPRLWSALNPQRVRSPDSFINEPLWLAGGRGQQLHQRSLCAPSASEDSSCFRRARELKINKYEKASLPSQFFSRLVPARGQGRTGYPQKDRPDRPDARQAKPRDQSCHCTKWLPFSPRPLASSKNA